MRENVWVFDTVSLSNFLLAEASFILEKRYSKCGFVTWEVYDELSAGFAKYSALKRIDR